MEFYALPDLHGRLDLLQAAIKLLPKAHLVVLGDVIDRGPQSLACVRLLLERRALGLATLLMGNHEQMAQLGLRRYRRYQHSHDLQEYRSAMRGFARWMQVGGDTVRAEGGGFGVENYPPELELYLDSLELQLYLTQSGQLQGTLPKVPSILLNHAGPPKVTSQLPDAAESVLWLRPSDGPFTLPPGVLYSVHGHTPVRAPLQLGQQVYLDLGAYQTGQLAVLPLTFPEPGEVTVLQGPGRGARGLLLLGQSLPTRSITIS